MNTIEERIRAAARAAADTVPPDSVPPLELPAGRPSGFRFRRRRDARSSGATWAARVAPAAAALAVIAVVIAMVALVRTGTGSPASSDLAAPAAPGGVPAGPPAASYAESGRVPPYYVTITPHGGRSYAMVQATVSGNTVATIRPSVPGGTIVAMTAAGDARTFVLGEQKSSPGPKAIAIAFYEFRLGSSGQPGALTRLPMSVPAGEWMNGLALSPDGGRLAIAIRPAAGIQRIRVYPVSGGPARTWSGDGTIGAPYATRSLSWPATQRTLAFNWTSGQSASVRLLDLGTAGGSLLADSRQVTSLGGTAGAGGTVTSCPGNSIITPDGSAIVCAASQVLRMGANGTIRQRSTGLAEFSTATGRLTRILGNWPSSQAGPTAMDVLWSDASGRVLIGVIAAAGQTWVGVISGNGFTPLNVRWDPAAPDFGTW